ncbi:Nucleolar protein 58 [Varicellaria rhodocarpa]|nr:Nucleolar protein 58 [Varicellaria rhodocarpa]
MVLFILTETSAGYALLKASDKKLLTRDSLIADTESAEQICSLLKLKNFQKFDSAIAALEEAAAIVEGKVTPRLTTLLDSIKDEKKVSLAVADPKLGNAINKLPQFSITPISDSTTADLYRSIRNHLSSLIPGLLPQDISTMSLGLSHSLSRHKLKFSPDKVDTMIVQAIALLDDLDKELNTYAMRVKEWYGWHFPEMGRIVNDNVAYARVILGMGMRTNATNADLAEILPEEIETAVKAAAEVSMGTEITTDDLENIQALAEQVVSFTEYRQQLSDYLSARMTAIAPNLTALVGDLVGARLISHAGSLMNLAKVPASTVQILGAEKALFRALKTKHDTPKYGLIYHASLVGQATGRNKGKMARALAAKASLGVRVDALADWSAEGEGKGDTVTEEEKSAVGVSSRIKLERRLAGMEGRPLRSKGVSIAPNGVSHQPGKWEVKEARKYNPDADGLAGDEPAAAVPVVSKAEKSKGKDVKMIEEVRDEDMSDVGSSDEDEEMEDRSPAGPSTDAVPSSAKQPEEKSDSDDSDMEDEPSTAPVSKAAMISEEKAKPILTVSTIPDSPDTSRKDRKKQKHQQKPDVSEEQSKKAGKDAKLVRRLDRKDRHQKEMEKPARSEEHDDEKYALLADQAGLSISRYKRKLERGEIKFTEDGTPQSVSKKDIKRAQKAAKKAEKEARKVEKEVKKAEKEVKKIKKEVSKAEKAINDVANSEAVAGKKRKRIDDGGDVVEKLDKKKKKKRKE